MNHSSTSDLLNLLVFQKYAAYLTLMLLLGPFGFACSVRPYPLKLRSFPTLPKCPTHAEIYHNRWGVKDIGNENAVRIS
jgi:hypothetical protein